MACSTERPIPSQSHFRSTSNLKKKKKDPTNCIPKPQPSVVSTAHKPDYAGNCLLETDYNKHNGLYGMNGLTPSDWSLLTAPSAAYGVPFTTSSSIQNQIIGNEKKKKGMDCNHFMDFNKLNLSNNNGNSGNPANLPIDSQSKSSVNGSECVYPQNSEISGSRSAHSSSSLSPSTSSSKVKTSTLESSFGSNLNGSSMFSHFSMMQSGVPVDVTNTIIHSNL